jgi:hypothetical protein
MTYQNSFIFTSIAAHGDETKKYSTNEAELCQTGLNNIFHMVLVPIASLYRNSANTWWIFAHV